MLMSFSASFNLLSLRIQSSLLTCLCMTCFAVEICQFNPKFDTVDVDLFEMQGPNRRSLSCEKTHGARRGSCIHRLHSTVLLC